MKTSATTSLLLVLLLMPLLFAFGQRKGAARAKAKAANSQTKTEQKEPSLDETIAWLKEKISASAFYKKEFPGGSNITYKVDEVEFEGCTLSYRATSTDTSSPQPRSTIWKFKVPLSALDPDQITVSALLKDGSAYFIKALTIQNQPKVQYRRDSIFLGERDVEEKPYTSIEIDFTDQEIANRVAKALAHAGTLCSAKKEPF